MFGGLEVKDEEKEARAPPASIASSAFSFMMGGGSVPAESAPAPSAFSFLSNPTAPPEPAASSGFSFMGGLGALNAQEGSSFDFMSASTVHDIAPVAPVIASTNPHEMEPPPATYAPSSFSLMPEPEAPSYPSYTSPAVGAGVTFGGAAANKVIKRRTRTVKVGGARAGDLPPSVMYPPPTSSPALQSHAINLEPPKSMPSAHMDADEAARRAEQFMAAMQQQSSISPTISGMKSPGSSFAPPVDVELETAKKAAETAHARLTKEKEKNSAFKWFAAPRSLAWGSNHGKLQDFDDRVDDMEHELGGAESDDSADDIPEDESPVDRITREQEQIKRAMAQRHAVMQEQEDSSNGFVPDMPRPAQPAPVAVFKFEKPKTPEEDMQQIFATFSSQVKKAMDGVSRLRQQRNMLLDERYVALAKERLAIQQIAQAEAQQMAAADADDFEGAERLQVTIDKHLRDKGELTAILDNIGRALTQLDSQTPGVVGAVSECFEDVEQQLKSFYNKLSSSDKEIGAEAQKRFQATAKVLSAEDERIKQELKHIERDEELANDERKELDSTILKQTAEMEGTKLDAIKKLESVQQDIIMLRKQLAEKESDVVRLKNEIGFQEQNISKVHVQFTRQQQRVQKKESAAELNRREWLNDKANYERLRDAHEAEVKEHSENLLAHTNLMDLLKKEFTLAATFRDIVAKEIGFDNNRNEAKEADGEMAGLQADVVKCEAAVAEAKQFVKVADAALVNLTAEFKTLQTRIPQLEAAKKDAAAARDFKTAGQASKEIKEAMVRLESCERELAGDAQMRKKEAEIKFKKVTKELAAMKAVADKQEEASGKEIMDKIATKIRKLIDTKNKVCGGDEGLNTKGMGAYVLKAQIDALKIEGQHFGSKFGGWDEIMTTIEALDNEPELPAKVKPKREEPAARPSDIVDPVLVAEGREIYRKIKDAEEALEAAVAREDYDEASELDELFKQIQAELEALGLTDAEAELALSGGAILAEEPVDEPAPTEGEAPQEPATDKEDETVNGTAANDELPYEENKSTESMIKEEAELAESPTGGESKTKEATVASNEQNGTSQEKDENSTGSEEFQDAVAAGEDAEHSEDV